MLFRKHRFHAQQAHLNLYAQRYRYPLFNFYDACASLQYKNTSAKKEGRGVCGTLRTNRAKLAWPALLPNDE